MVKFEEHFQVLFDHRQVRGVFVYGDSSKIIVV